VNDGLGQDGKYLQHISPLLAIFLYMGFLFLIRRIIFDLVALDMSLLWRVSSVLFLCSAQVLGMTGWDSRLCMNDVNDTLEPV
jgi:hypothetical protein